MNIGAGDRAPARPAPAESNRRRVLVGLLAVALVLVSGAFWWNMGQRADGNAGPGTTQSPSGGASAGVTPSPSGPAVPDGFVLCADGRLCPKIATCWLGLVLWGGKATAKKVDCSTKHYWETFVAGHLPEDAEDLNFEDLQKRSDIKQLCETSILPARLLDPTATGRWKWEALPVEVDDVWVVHCRASRIGETPRTAPLFRAGP